ncbi:MAG: glutathione synthase [Gammaproteobacteria bacterium]|nr:glutathione synthase [Gammaproteobacteria bacterium]
MTLRLGVVMDPIAAINIKKDSTFAMLLEAQRRGWPIAYMEQGDLFLRDGKTFARICTLRVQDNAEHWFDLGAETVESLSALDVILMRKDPPFDMEYIYATYLLERAETEGVLVVNKPQSLRDCNEKLFTARFPQCTPPTLVTRSKTRLRDFLNEFGDIILKPLGGMGGASVFRLRAGDPNLNVVIETMTEHEQRFVMAQKFIPEISEGDKRILMINGEPVPYALARIPAEGETRGNLAAGGRGVGVPLSPRDRWICEQVGPVLREKGLLFVGLDVIGDYLTEINVTSPTCVRELDALYGLNIAALLLDAVEKQVASDK